MPKPKPKANGDRGKEAGKPRGMVVVLRIVSVCCLNDSLANPKNYLALISIEKCARQQKLSVPANLTQRWVSALASVSFHSLSIHSVYIEKNGYICY